MPLGFPIVCGSLWFAGFWLITRNRIHSLRLVLLGMVGSMIGVALASPAIWEALAQGYPNDSFWTLGLVGRSGVIAISGLGIAGFFLLSAAKSRVILCWKRSATGTAWAFLDTSFGLFGFAVVYSLSPQAFYAFYRLLFPGLPIQWVIDSALNVDQLRGIATFSSDGSLSDHLAGITLWAIVPFTGWLHLRDWWRGGP